MPTTTESTLRTISPSQMRYWDHCPQAWEYSYNEELYRPEASRPFFDFGNYTHELMHVYYQLLQANPALKPGDDVLVRAMQSRVRSDLTGENLENVSKVWPRLQSWLINQSPKIDTKITVLGVEIEFKIPVTTLRGNSVLLHGFIDLLYRDSAGKVRIRDHKTGADSRAHSANSVKLDDQLLFYGVANDVPDVEINFVSSKILKTKEVPLAEQFALYRHQHTPAGLEIAKANLLNKIDVMLDSPTWKNYSPKCPNCQFFDICHIESRGLSTAGVKLNSYQRGKKNDRTKFKLEEGGGASEENSSGNSGFKISFTNL